jgi:tRNA pseudouridine55 synthase
MQEQPTGFLLIDKPAGITSHDVIDALRKITGIKKIGHAGTLDPFATGLLIVAVGRKATREISTFVKLNKIYEAEFVLGATTETLDSEGEIIKSDQVIRWSGDQVQAAMSKMTGAIEQIPPMHSAIKIKGKKLYELARQGKEVKREPRTVTIHQFDLIDEPIQEDGLTIIKTRIHCSSGTYIRALSRDLAETLGTTGYIRQLRRTNIAKHSVKEAHELDAITPENWPTLLNSLKSMQIDG